MSRILQGPGAISEAVERLRSARPVAFPTETVYGLGTDAFNAEAVEAVFALKGRPPSNPLIVHVSGIEMAKGVTNNWTAQADAIARAHWPGPVTLVLSKHESVPDVVCASGSTVAIRCPAHPVALALIEAFGGAIVGPSANPSGWISPTTPEHVADGFGDADLVIIDGGACHAGIESTVVDLTGETPRILRLGVLGADTLSNTLGMDVLIGEQVASDEPARSPGVIGAHYQPRTACRLVTSEEIEGLADPDIALIAWSITVHPAKGVLVPMDLGASKYAAGLYAAMHKADASAAKGIWIESPPTHHDDEPQSRVIWHAVLERLARATQSG